MDWALGKGYANPVKQLSGSVVVEATTNIYDTIAAGLLPTPMKSHYTSTSAHGQGLSRNNPRLAEGDQREGRFCELVVPRGARLLHDRLINDHDRTGSPPAVQGLFLRLWLRFREEGREGPAAMFGCILTTSRCPRSACTRRSCWRRIPESMDYFKDYNQNREGLVLLKCDGARVADRAVILNPTATRY